MTLTDAGPLIAIIDRGEPDHERVVSALGDLSAPMVTTWPAFTEAMYLLGSAGGWPAQEALWRLVQRGDLEIADLDGESLTRSRALMERYRDTPMDLADATLVALAEQRGWRRIMTLDHHFQVYRLHGKQPFTVLP